MSARNSYQQQQQQQRKGTTTKDTDVSINHNQGHPILFQHMGRKKHGDSHCILFASSQASRKPWIDQIYQLQTCINSPTSIFDAVPAVQRGQFKQKRINHVVPFRKLYFHHTSISLTIGICREQPASRICYGRWGVRW
jgi:hypothetical protein